MINSKGEIIDSIPNNCLNYSPNKDKPTKIKCSILNVLYECNNCKSKNGDNFRGCSFCFNYKNINDISYSDIISWWDLISDDDKIWKMMQNGFESFNLKNITFEQKKKLYLLKDK